MKENIADTMLEPPDGTMLVIKEYDGKLNVIFRCDGDRPGWAHEDERWFDDTDQDPLAWHEVMKYTEAVYTVSAQPTYTR